MFFQRIVMALLILCFLSELGVSLIIKVLTSVLGLVDYCLQVLESWNNKKAVVTIESIGDGNAIETLSDWVAVELNYQVNNIRPTEDFDIRYVPLKSIEEETEDIGPGVPVYTVQFRFARLSHAHLLVSTKVFWSRSGMLEFSSFKAGRKCDDLYTQHAFLRAQIQQALAAVVQHLQGKEAKRPLLVSKTRAS